MNAHAPIMGETTLIGGMPAKQVGNVWLPASEEHLVDWMTRQHKHSRTVRVNGREFATYQYHKLQAALDLVNTRGVALDVGAHCGLWSMWLGREFQHLIAFEPVREHRALWQRNVGATCDGLGHLLELYGAAVGAAKGTVVLDWEPTSTGNTHVVAVDGDAVAASTAASQGGRQVEAPVMTIDSLGLEDCDLIKIDTEGFELQVVRGARETIERCRPVIVVEQKGHATKFYGAERTGAVQFLESLGMRTERVLSGDHLMVW